jgi:hypothetical protein
MKNNIPPYRPLELMQDSKITKFDCQDFIGVWENFVPASFCDKLIEYFAYIEENHSIIELDAPVIPDGMQAQIMMRGEDQYNGGMNRKDVSFLLNYTSATYTYQVYQFLISCVQHYITEFSQLAKTSLFSTDVKFQKTSPGGGYHLWHYENGAESHGQREFTWMIYLNDIPDGEGETEFLYQHRRIKPTKGTVVIFPAGYTHVHKGNTVLTTDKYILTGWYIKK